MTGISKREEIETEAEGKHLGGDWVVCLQAKEYQYYGTQEDKRNSWNRFSPRAFREHGSADILISDF